MVNVDTIKENLRSIVLNVHSKSLNAHPKLLNGDSKSLNIKKSLGLILFFYKPITFFLQAYNLFPMKAKASFL